MTPSPDPACVFVVYGRNEAGRRAFFEFLRSLGLRPVEWAHAVRESGKGAPFIGEVLDNAFERAQAIVVLLTGDDVAKLRPELLREDDSGLEAELAPQARANVLFEAGLAFGRHDERTILVQLGYLKPFSDIAGRHIVRFKDDIASRQDVASRLSAAGCPVDLVGTDWHTSGDFTWLTEWSAPRSDKPASGQESELQIEELKILQFLAEREEQGASESETADAIAHRCDLSLPRAKHFLAELEDQDLVFASLSIGAPTRFYLSRGGRAKLVALGLI